MTDAVMPMAGADPLVAELARMLARRRPGGPPPGSPVLALWPGWSPRCWSSDAAPGLGMLLTGLAIGATRRCRRCGTGWVRTRLAFARPRRACCSRSSWCATRPGWSR